MLFSIFPRYIYLGKMEKASDNLQSAAARRRGRRKIRLKMERRERSTSKTGLLWEKMNHRKSRSIHFTPHLDCVEPFTLTVCEGSHVKEESPRIRIRKLFISTLLWPTCHKSQEGQERRGGNVGWRQFWRLTARLRQGRTKDRYSWFKHRYLWDWKLQ